MNRHMHLCSPETSAAVANFRGSKTWRQTAELLDYAETCAPILCAIARGKPGQTTPEGEQELRRRLGLSYDVRHIVDVPADHDAAVHLHPNGNGSLHTYTVPADAEVVIVPAGARVVQSKPASKPTRKRWRIDLSPYAGRVTAEQVRELIECHLAANPIDAGSPARVLRLVGDWLAEDASIDPIVVSGEIAAVLARLE